MTRDQFNTFEWLGVDALKTILPDAEPANWNDPEVPDGPVPGSSERGMFCNRIVKERKEQESRDG